VRVLQDGECLHKTRTRRRTLDPDWDSEAELLLAGAPVLLFRVFDRDRLVSDDFMGETKAGRGRCPPLPQVALEHLEAGPSHRIQLPLQAGPDPGLAKRVRRGASLGSLQLSLTLGPVSKEAWEAVVREERAGEEAPSLLHTLLHPRQGALAQETRRGSGDLRAREQEGVVEVVLVRAVGLLAADRGGSSDPYCRAVLGRERARTATVFSSLCPEWREALTLTWQDRADSRLLVEVFDWNATEKDDFLGSLQLDLGSVEPEVTHSLWRELEGGPGHIQLLVTVSATGGSDTGPGPEHLRAQYGLAGGLRAGDIGWLEVSVVEAEGLRAADLNGRSDPFAVVELGNQRLRTTTEPRTLHPAWNCRLSFDVPDVHEVLEVTVFDDNRDHRHHFLGKVRCVCFSRR
jgi:hypothetical protein